jgi:hypothetical protein
MKSVFLCSLGLMACFAITAQDPAKAENIFIITTDGFRWQEIFNGADSSLISNPKFVEDTSLIRQLYWDSDLEIRRRKLMPFFWNVIAEKGQLYGNRGFGNKVNVKNFYKISYPGYNEIFTGTTDPGIIINLPRNNKNTNILEYLNNTAEYRGKVAAFSSWNLFPYIFNKDRRTFTLNSGYTVLPNEDADTSLQIINKIQQNVVHKSNTRYDWLTYFTAREYVEKYHPRIVFIGLGETDEFAHQGRYDLYLQQASAIDKMIGDLWYYTQTHPFYKNKTSFIITTDHGRGNTESSWVTHSLLTRGSGETWLAMIGNGITSTGELKTVQQTYQKQLASTIAILAGKNFVTPNKTGKPINLPEMPQNMELTKYQHIVAK